MEYSRQEQKQIQITIKEVHLCRNGEVDRETAGQPEAGRVVEIVLDDKINKYGK